MKLEFDKRYPVAALPEQAWAVLADFRATAACWPGGVLSTQLDSRRYRGGAAVPIGADTLQVEGGLELIALDAPRRELRLRGHGEAAGGSPVSVDLVARIEAGELADTSALVGRAAVTVDGALAAFDKRLLASAGDRLLAQFVDHFRAAAAAAPAPPRRAGPPAPGRKGGGAESTLTLMVQAGQEPGAAFAPPAGEASAAAGRPASAWRRWWGGLFGRR